MAGFILLLLGFLKVGTVIRFIPAPIIVGFTAGIAVIIWVDQWQDFFGLPSVTGEHFHTKLIHLFQVIPQMHFATTVLALFSLFIVIYSSRIPFLKRIPGPLAALIIATFLEIIFNFDGVKTIGTAFGGILQGIPGFHVPDIGWVKVVELIGPAFTIAMLGAIESLLSAVVADGMAGTHHDSNQELIGQGLASIVAPLFGGFAATGAIVPAQQPISRTAAPARYLVLCIR